MDESGWQASVGVDRQCCMVATVEGSTAVVIRRDLLLAAGCRSTAHSLNNGDGKMHRPDDIVSGNVFHGNIDLDSGRPPFNFDYPSVLNNVPRASMDSAGVNSVCLLPAAYQQLADAECALVTQRDTTSTVPDKSRQPFVLQSGILPDEEHPPSLPWQASPPCLKRAHGTRLTAAAGRDVHRARSVCAPREHRGCAARSRHAQNVWRLFPDQEDGGAGERSRLPPSAVLQHPRQRDARKHVVHYAQQRRDPGYAVHDESCAVHF